MKSLHKLFINCIFVCYFWWVCEKKMIVKKCGYSHDTTFFQRLFSNDTSEIIFYTMLLFGLCFMSIITIAVEELPIYIIILLLADGIFLFRMYCVMLRMNIPYIIYGDDVAFRIESSS